MSRRRESPAQELRRLVLEQRLELELRSSTSTSSARRSIVVHPNSAAGKKWRRTTWQSGRNLWAEAADARRAGDVDRAQALRRRAARDGSTDLHCG